MFLAYSAKEMYKREEKTTHVEMVLLIHFKFIGKFLFSKIVFCSYLQSMYILFSFFECNS